MSETYFSDESIEKAFYLVGFFSIVALSLLLAFMILVTPAQAAEGKTIIPSEPTIKIVRTGTTPLLSLAATKSPSDKMKTISTETLKTMRTGTISGSTVTIVKYRYDAEKRAQGYWCTATRGGREVAINNPIWIGEGAPIDILVSETTDTKINEITLTVKEDPKSAMEQILIRVANSAPLGKMVTGTKE
jgi:hypothetical protein